MSFADLKRKSQNNFSFLQKELEKSASGKNVDDRFWKPEVDASGNGYAVIRFLPAPDGETIPWAKLYSHAFQGPGGWYIENSLTTLNEKDPVGEVNRRLWNSGTDVLVWVLPECSEPSGILWVSPVCRVPSFL